MRVQGQDSAVERAGFRREVDDLGLRPSSGRPDQQCGGNSERRPDEARSTRSFIVHQDRSFQAMKERL
jgi:hypothetical protein